MITITFYNINMVSENKYIRYMYLEYQNFQNYDNKNTYKNSNRNINMSFCKFKYTMSINFFIYFTILFSFINSEEIKASNITQTSENITTLNNSTNNITVIPKTNFTDFHFSIILFFRTVFIINQILNTYHIYDNDDNSM